MKVLVLGKQSFIAQHLSYEILPDRIPPNNQAITDLLKYHKPDIIINCIAYTGGKNIDGCEIDKERTITSNLIIPTLLATECNKLNIRFINLSSGCIFYGESPNLKHSLVDIIDTGWNENNNPKLENASFYSKIKYAADLAIKDLPNTTILRLRMPISSSNNPRNLINKLLKYENVLECPNSVTFIFDLVRVIDWVIKYDKRGIYHITNPDPLTHIEILEEYRRYNPKHHFNIINEEQLKQYTTAPRSNCLLSTAKLNNEGFHMTPTKQALVECMAEYVKGINQ